MKKTKKQLLGLAGLVAVGIMTAVAFSLPAQDASAMEQDTVVNVQVTEGTPSNTFTAPQDGSETVNGIVKVSTNYSQARRLNYRLSYKDQNGVVQQVDLPSYSPTDDSGTYSFDVDITPYGFGEFTLHTSVTGYDNVTRDTDTVTFSYSAVIASVNPGTNGSSNPTLGVEISDSTERVEVTVFDQNGNPAFVDEHGNIVKLQFNRSDIDPATGKILVNLPFGQYGSKAGTYTAVVAAYDQNDQLLSMKTVQVEYNPAAAVTPDTPNTGMLSLGDFNISHLDYLITGLIAFAAAAIFALALIYRKSRR